MGRELVNRNSGGGGRIRFRAAHRAVVAALAVAKIAERLAVAAAADAEPVGRGAVNGLAVSADAVLGCVPFHRDIVIEDRGKSRGSRWEVRG
jgi:hypothetical protein